jgi:hypothetical protein
MLATNPACRSFCHVAFILESTSAIPLKTDKNITEGANLSPNFSFGNYFNSDFFETHILDDLN